MDLHAPVSDNVCKYEYLSIEDGGVRGVRVGEGGVLQNKRASRQHLERCWPGGREARFGPATSQR